MGNLWYVREGSSPTGPDPRCQLSFAKIQQLFGKHEIKYLGTTPPTFPSSASHLDGFRKPAFVVFELLDTDPSDEPVSNRIGFKSEPLNGFYRIFVSIEECEAILASENA